MLPMQKAFRLLAIVAHVLVSFARDVFNDVEVKFLVSRRRDGRRHQGYHYRINVMCLIIMTEPYTDHLIIFGFKQ